MQTNPHNEAEESQQNQEEHRHIPFNGFVNVNDIVRKRRQLRNAEFNVADESWDADFNQQTEQRPKGDPG
ncbi:hypothetical protein [Pedobacter hartonius]|uniref:Uncharacterized protein n=1 Tax=Pedobacter hartonius TaxID=425514 RepID=A0A1H4E1S1_9SPHI|nr:hypothetical protein [Pedobacter hartonius]SEA78342.1 hypothetical protein SAMN05443550_105181 [Pedobacter hartonius]